MCVRSVTSYALGSIEKNQRGPMAVINTGYEPRPFQAYLHAKLKRFSVVVAHRRFGKSIFSINEIIDKALRNNLKNPKYAYIAPTYAQAKKVLWDAAKDYTKNFPGVLSHEQEMKITIPRPQYDDKITIALFGGDSPDSLRGIYLDGAVVDEVSQIDPRVWTEVLRPALSDRLGWCLFIGTPQSKNYFYKLYEHAKKEENKDWFAGIYKASQTGIIPQEELDDMRAIMDESEYEQELECSFSSGMRGAYWAKDIEALEKNDQVGLVPHDPALLVDTAWDLGVSDMTTIWFVQQYRQEIRIIDYYEANGMGLDHYVRVLKEGHRSKYSYREHNFPHDGSARDLSSGKTREQVMRDLGMRVYVRPRYDVADSINAVRMMLPKCYFDESLCSVGLNGLKNYQRIWDAKMQVYQPKPRHDAASHPADAFRLLAMCLKPGEDRIDRRKMKRYAENDWDIFGGKR